jgi:DNA-binding response OmpR family regulator
MIKLLIVDDEQGICDCLEDYFTRVGHKVFTVTNPLKALAIVKKEQPQIIVLDILMPQMNGLELLPKIREKSKTAKIIMLTVADDPATKAKALKLGANYFMNKPFSTDDVEQVIMTQISKLVTYTKKDSKHG